jgi:hypothetical protein
VDVADPGAPPAILVTITDDHHEVDVALVDATPADLALVDKLLRLQLAAGRRGWRVVLREIPDELRGLLELTGCSSLLGLEPSGEPELGEELREEEVVQPGDAPA